MSLLNKQFLDGVFLSWPHDYQLVLGPASLNGKVLNYIVILSPKTNCFSKLLF